MDQKVIFGNDLSAQSSDKSYSVCARARVNSIPFYRLLIFAMLSVALSQAQVPTEVEAPEYREAPQPRCDSFTMLNRIRLTALEKACYYRDQVFTPSAMFGAAIFGGIAQAIDSPSDWPQGAKGFAWRAGTRYAQGMTKTTVSFLAGLSFHEDPRALRPECEESHAKTTVTKIATMTVAPKGFWRRLGGAVAENFWAENDYCNMRPVFSASAGALASGFVGMAWTPDPSNTVTKAMVRSGTALGGTIGSSIFAEFKGDITRLVSHGFKRTASSSKGSEQ